MGCENDYGGGGRGNRYAGGGRCEDPIDREARMLSNALDHRDGQTVADMLRRDAQTMHPRAFNRLIEETAMMDRKGIGDDLYVDRRTGRVDIVANGHRYTHCHMGDEQRGLPPVIIDYGRGRDYGGHRGHDSNALEGAVIGGAIGAITGAIIDRRDPGKGAAIGGIAGAIGGAIGGSMDNDNHHRRRR